MFFQLFNLIKNAILLNKSAFVAFNVGIIALNWIIALICCFRKRKIVHRSLSRPWGLNGPPINQTKLVCNSGGRQVRLAGNAGYQTNQVKSVNPYPAPPHPQTHLFKRRPNKLAWHPRFHLSPQTEEEGTLDEVTWMHDSADIVSNKRKETNADFSIKRGKTLSSINSAKVLERLTPVTKPFPSNFRYQPSDLSDIKEKSQNEHSTDLDLNYEATDFENKLQKTKKNEVAITKLSPKKGNKKYKEQSTNRKKSQTSIMTTKSLLTMKSEDSFSSVSSKQMFRPINPLYPSVESFSAGAIESDECSQKQSLESLQSKHNIENTEKVSNMEVPNIFNEEILSFMNNAQNLVTHDSPIHVSVRSPVTILRELNEMSGATNSASFCRKWKQVVNDKKIKELLSDARFRQSNESPITVEEQNLFPSKIKREKHFHKESKKEQHVKRSPLKAEYKNRKPFKFRAIPLIKTGSKPCKKKSNIVVKSSDLHKPQIERAHSTQYDSSEAAKQSPYATELAYYRRSPSSSSLISQIGFKRPFTNKKKHTKERKTLINESASLKWIPCSVSQSSINQCQKGQEKDCTVNEGERNSENNFPQQQILQSTQIKRQRISNWLTNKSGGDLYKNDSSLRLNSRSSKNLASFSKTTAASDSMSLISNPKAMQSRPDSKLSRSTVTCKKKLSDLSINSGVQCASKMSKNYSLDHSLSSELITKVCPSRHKEISCVDSSEASGVCKRDSWIWFSHDLNSEGDSFQSRKERFKSEDPRVAELALEIRRQEQLNRDIEREAESLIESSPSSKSLYKEMWESAMGKHKLVETLETIKEATTKENSPKEIEQKEAVKSQMSTNLEDQNLQISYSKPGIAEKSNQCNTQDISAHNVQTQSPKETSLASFTTENQRTSRIPVWLKKDCIQSPLLVQKSHSFVTSSPNLSPSQAKSTHSKGSSSSIHNISGIFTPNTEAFALISPSSCLPKQSLTNTLQKSDIDLQSKSCHEIEILSNDSKAREATQTKDQLVQINITEEISKIDANLESNKSIKDTPDTNASPFCGVVNCSSSTSSSKLKCNSSAGKDEVELDGSKNTSAVSIKVGLSRTLSSLAASSSNESEITATKEKSNARAAIGTEISHILHGLLFDDDPSSKTERIAQCSSPCIKITSSSDIVVARSLPPLKSPSDTFLFTKCNLRERMRKRQGSWPTDIVIDEIDFTKKGNMFRKASEFFINTSESHFLTSFSSTKVKSSNNTKHHINVLSKDYYLGKKRLKKGNSLCSVLNEKSSNDSLKRDNKFLKVNSKNNLSDQSQPESKASEKKKKAYHFFNSSRKDRVGRSNTPSKNRPTASARSTCLTSKSAYLNHNANLLAKGCRRPLPTTTQSAFVLPELRKSELSKCDETDPPSFSSFTDSFWAGKNKEMINFRLQKLSSPERSRLADTFTSLRKQQLSPVSKSKENFNCKKIWKTCDKTKKGVNGSANNSSSYLPEYQYLRTSVLLKGENLIDKTKTKSVRTKLLQKKKIPSVNFFQKNNDHMLSKVSLRKMGDDPKSSETTRAKNIKCLFDNVYEKHNKIKWKTDLALTADRTKVSNCGFQENIFVAENKEIATLLDKSTVKINRLCEENISIAASKHELKKTSHSMKPVNEIELPITSSDEEFLNEDEDLSTKLSTLTSNTHIEGVKFSSITIHPCVVNLQKENDFVYDACINSSPEASLLLKDGKSGSTNVDSGYDKSASDKQNASISTCVSSCDESSGVIPARPSKLMEPLLSPLSISLSSSENEACYSQSSNFSDSCQSSLSSLSDDQKRLSDSQKNELTTYSLTGDDNELIKRASPLSVSDFKLELSPCSVADLKQLLGDLTTVENEEKKSNLESDRYTDSPIHICNNTDQDFTASEQLSPNLSTSKTGRNRDSEADNLKYANTENGTELLPNTSSHFLFKTDELSTNQTTAVSISSFEDVTTSDTNFSFTSNNTLEKIETSTIQQPEPCLNTISQESILLTLSNLDKSSSDALDKAMENTEDIGASLCSNTFDTNFFEENVTHESLKQESVDSVSINVYDSIQFKLLTVDRKKETLCLDETFGQDKRKTETCNSDDNAVDLLNGENIDTVGHSKDAIKLHDLENDLQLTDDHTVEKRVKNKDIIPFRSVAFQDLIRKF